MTQGSPGFSSVTISDRTRNYYNNVQQSEPHVRLIGDFNIIKSRANGLRLDVDNGTNIINLDLYGSANLTGNANITTAKVFSNGTIITSNPQNVILYSGVTNVNVGGQVLYSSRSIASNTEIRDVRISQSDINIVLSNYIADIDSLSFKITATLDGVPYELNNLLYDNAQSRFTYSPIPLVGNIGKILTITVRPREGNDKVTGVAKTVSLRIGTGFSGRVEDVMKFDASNVVISFRAGNNVTTGNIVATAFTDEYGNYSINLPPGVYTGEFSGMGYSTSFMVVECGQTQFNINQNGVVVRNLATD